MRHGRQAGSALAEMAIVIGLFLMVLFGVIEIARALYVWNTLTEVTRRGARVAAVCHPVDHPALIKNVATDILPGLGAGNVAVTYYGQDGTAVAATDFMAIRYVRVEITGYSHSFMVPYLDRVLTPPPFQTTLPRESLGVPRDKVVPSECPFPA
jgi:Flp pilus assembly protein TadG